MGDFYLSFTTNVCGRWDPMVPDRGRAKNEGRTMLDEVASVEKVEAELSAFIDRQAKGNAADNDREELWKSSVRKYHACLNRERLLERLGWHQAQLERHTATFEALLRRHRVGLRVCEEALGIPTSEEGDAT